MNYETMSKVYQTLQDMEDMFEELADKYEFQSWMEENTNIEEDTFAKMYFNLDKLRIAAEQALEEMPF